MARLFALGIGELRLPLKRFSSLYDARGLYDAYTTMAPFGLTVLAALTLWSIVHLLLNAFVGDQPNFPNENPLEFVVNSVLLLIVGWMMTGVAYAIGRFKMNQSTAFTTCISTMAVFAYLVAVSTHNKILRSVKPLEKKVDRIMICKTYPQARGC